MPRGRRAAGVGGSPRRVHRRRAASRERPIRRARRPTPIGDHSRRGTRTRPRRQRCAREAARPYSRNNLALLFFETARRGPPTSAPSPLPALADSPLTPNLLLPNTPRDIHRRRTPRRSSRTRPRSRRHPQAVRRHVPPWHHPLLPGQQACPSPTSSKTPPRPCEPTAPPARTTSSPRRSTFLTAATTTTPPSSFCPGRTRRMLA